MTRQWATARIVEDRVEVPIPADLRATSLTAYVGLFRDSYRSSATPREKTDGTDRVVGPTVRIHDP